MRGVMAYCAQEKKTYDQKSHRLLVSGVNCVGANAPQEFLATKRVYSKTDGMNFYQYVQSFSPEEKLSPAEAHQIALEFAAKAWPGHEILVTTHCDAPHLHSHFVINSVSFENGYKLRQSPNTLKTLRAVSDEICRAHGLTVLEPYEKSGAKLSAREYRAAEKNQSWKFRLMGEISRAMERCGSREEFLRHMKERGYTVRWTAERKYITFICPNGMKCRDNKLHDDKFLKERLELEFELREQITEELRFGHPDGADKEHAGNLQPDPLPPGGLRPALGMAGRNAEAPGEPSAIPACPAQADGQSGHSGTGRAGSGLARGENRGSPAGGSTTYSGGASENVPGVGGSYLTGWEESRRKYFDRLLGRAGQAQEGTYPSYHLGKRGNSGLIRAGLFGLLEAGALIQSEEDEEERRKRIEAQENGEALGAALGLAAGAFAALTEEIEEQQQWLS